MCLLKWLMNSVAVAVNFGLGVWTLSFPGEWMAISLVFFIPAGTAVTLGCSPAGSTAARIASILVISLGVVKLIFAAVAAVFAAEAGRRRDQDVPPGLGWIVFTILSTLSGASAISDLVIGCSAYCRWRERRQFHRSLELSGYKEEDL